jgi:hypothetical protein
MHAPQRAERLELGEVRRTVSIETPRRAGTSAATTRPEASSAVRISA